MSFVHVFILLSALGLKTLGTLSLLFEHGSEGVFKELWFESRKQRYINNDGQCSLFHFAPFPFQPVLTKKKDLYC